MFDCVFCFWMCVINQHTHTPTVAAVVAGAFGARSASPLAALSLLCSSPQPSCPRGALWPLAALSARTRLELRGGGTDFDDLPPEEAWHCTPLLPANKNAAGDDDDLLALVGALPALKELACGSDILGSEEHIDGIGDVLLRGLTRLACAGQQSYARLAPPTTLREMSYSGKVLMPPSAPAAAPANDGASVLRDLRCGQGCLWVADFDDDDDDDDTSARSFVRLAASSAGAQLTRLDVGSVRFGHEHVRALADAMGGRRFLPSLHTLSATLLPDGPELQPLATLLPHLRSLTLAGGALLDVAPLAQLSALSSLCVELSLSVRGADALAALATEGGLFGLRALDVTGNFVGATLDRLPGARFFFFFFCLHPPTHRKQLFTTTLQAPRSRRSA